MGYMREKYTKGYYLTEETKDEQGNPIRYGAAGVRYFKKGGIRKQDRRILDRLRFRGRRVLDIGYGRGEAIKYAVERGAAAAAGVDFSEAAHAIASEFLRAHGVPADLHCDEALGFITRHAAAPGSARFDVVLMLDFVEHVPRKELRLVMEALRRVLSDRAVVAVHTPVFPVDNDVIADGLNPLARDFSDELKETRGMHCNRYTRESLQAFMAGCGFAAIGAQFFVPRAEPPLITAAGRWAWLQAFRRGYPVALSGTWRREKLTLANSVAPPAAPSA